MAQRVRVLRYTFEKGIGDARALIVSLQQLLVVRIRDKTDLRKDRGHVSADQDDEGGLLDAAIFQS